jgi:diguanylate cyclase (GGDEF)-like protein/PAS domain S-box-containing protein
MKAAIESSARDVAVQNERVPVDEAERLASVLRLGLLDTPPAEYFDAVARLAATALRVPVLLVSLIDDHRLWFKARIGLDACEAARATSFCTHTILERRPFIVLDATADPRFENSPWVTAAPYVRSYAGVPLFTRDRQPVGTLCAMDAQVRRFGDVEVALLSEYAKIIEEFFCAKELAVKADSVFKYAMEREKLFRETFEQAAVGIVHTSLSGSVLRVNQRACTLLGYSLGQLRGQTLVELTHPEDLPKNVVEFKRMLAGEIDSYRLEQRLLCKDQRYLWASLSVGLKRTASHLPDYAIVVLDDISVKKQAEADLVNARDALQEKVTLQTRRLQESNEALQMQVKQALDAAAALREAQGALQASNNKLAAESVTDYLTGLPNRRSFSRRSEQAAQALRQSQKPYGLILLDVDNFKLINDHHGHDVGDDVLRAMSRILTDQLRNSSDLAARLGGDEFAVLCFGDISEQTLHDVAERIRDHIGKEALATPKGLVRFTGSLGLALSLPDDPDWKTIYGRADAALYEAKAAGKDRISFGRSYSKSATGRLKALQVVPPPS